MVLGIDLLLDFGFFGKIIFLFYLNNFHSQKVKPCCRTTRFSAGLHCQAQKGRWTVLQGGEGYLASCETFVFGENSLQVANKAHVPSSKLHETTLSRIGGTSPSLVACAHFIIYKKSLLNPAVRCLQN
jgi:hypothetical protein